MTKLGTKGALVTAALMVGVVCMLAPLRLAAFRHGEDAEDRVGLFSNIVVTEDHPAADVVCAFCTITIDGDVHGDVAAIFSTLNVGEGRTISGDVAMLFSTMQLGEGARVHGDVASVLGTTNLAESAHIDGDRAIFASGLGFAVVLAPVLIAIGVIWLLVWAVRRVAL